MAKHMGMIRQSKELSDLLVSQQASLVAASVESRCISSSGRTEPWLKTPLFRQEQVHAHLLETQASI
jgi:hypothetical protein